MTTKDIEAASEAARFALRMGLAVSEVVSFVLDLGEECPMINLVFDTLEAIREKIGEATSNRGELALLEERCSYFIACAIARGRVSKPRVNFRPLVQLVEDIENLVEKCGHRWCICKVVNATTDKRSIAELHKRLGNLTGHMGLEQTVTEKGKIKQLAKLIEDPPPDSRLSVAVGPESNCHTASSSQSNEDLENIQSFSTSPLGAQPIMDPGGGREGLLAHFRRVLKEAHESLESSHCARNGRARDLTDEPLRGIEISQAPSPADSYPTKQVHEAEMQLDLARRAGQGDDRFSHREVVESLRHLARLTESHDWTKAKRLYLRALAMDDVKLGAKSLEVAETLQSLGRGCLRVGRAKESEAACARALRILWTKLDPEHEEVGYALEALGCSLLKQGRTDEAEPLLQRAIDILEDVSTLRAKFIVLRLRHGVDI